MDRIFRRPILILVLIVSAILGGTVVRSFQDSAPSALPGTVPKSPQQTRREWRTDLVRPTPRLAYSTNQGFYLTPLGKPPELLADVVDVQRAQPSYVDEFVWSPNARYLAWRQSTIDPTLQDRPVPQPTMTLLDTDNGMRRSWSAAEFGSLVFFNETLLSWTGNGFLIFDMDSSRPQSFTIPEIPETVLVGAARDGIVVQDVSTVHNIARFWLVSPNGSARDLGSVTSTGEFEEFSVHPSSNAIAALSEHYSSPCNWVNRITLSADLALDFKEVALPPLSRKYGWHISSFGFGAEGTLTAILNRAVKPCEGVVLKEIFTYLRGDRMVIDSRLANVKRIFSAKRSSDGQVAVNTGVHEVTIMGASGNFLAIIRDVQLWSWAP